MDAEGWKLVDAYMELASNQNRNKLENKLQERGWKIEGFRYISPGGNFSDSHIHQVCVYLKNEAEAGAEEDPSVQREEVQEREDALLLEEGPEREDPQRKRKLKQVIIPEYLPEAVEEYMRVKKGRALAKKAKQHLLYLGWKIEDILRSKGRFEERYISPEKNRGYGSLLSACNRATKAKEAQQQQQQQQEEQQQQQPQPQQQPPPKRAKKMSVRKSVSFPPAGLDQA